MASRLKRLITESKSNFEFRRGEKKRSSRFFSRLNFEFILNRGKPNEKRYEFSTREPLNGPIEYNKSYLTVSFNFSFSNFHDEIFRSIFSTKKITSFGLFINLNLGKTLISTFSLSCVCVAGFSSLLFSFIRLIHKCRKFVFECCHVLFIDLKRKMRKRFRFVYREK